MAESQAKPRLLIVTSTYPRWPGDTEPSFVHQLAARLVGRFEVIVSTSSAPGAKAFEIMDGVKVMRYRYAPSCWESLVYGGGLIANLKAAPWKLLLLPSYLLAWVWQVWQLRRNLEIDAIHAHWFIPGALVATLAGGKTPRCVTAHGSDVLGLRAPLWQGLRRFIAGDADAITAVGARICDSLETEGIQGIRLLPMGVDLSHTFYPSIHGTRSFRLIYVGRLTSSKRPHQALLAFSNALQAAPKLILDIVGDGPERESLEHLANSLGIQSQLHFHGRKSQEEIAAMFRTAAVLICPSGSDDAPEGLGLVAIEALGCGCPVVSSPNAALQTAIPPAAPIYYAADSSADALCTALIRALKENSITREHSGPWRDQLLKTFCWDKIARDYGDILEGLIEDRYR